MSTNGVLQYQIDVCTNFIHRACDIVECDSVNRAEAKSLLSELLDFYEYVNKTKYSYKRFQARWKEFFQYNKVSSFEEYKEKYDLYDAFSVKSETVPNEVLEIHLKCSLYLVELSISVLKSKLRLKK